METAMSTQNITSIIGQNKLVPKPPKVETSTGAEVIAIALFTIPITNNPKAEAKINVFLPKFKSFCFIDFFIMFDFLRLAN